MTKLQELVTTGAGVEGSLLIAKTIYANIVEAAQSERIGRDKAAMYIGPGEIQGSSVDIDLEDEASNLKFQAIAEGTGVPLSAITYSSTNVKPVKYGTRLAVTREMIEDGKWNQVEFNLKNTGRQSAELEDTLIIAQLDTAANTVSGSTAVTIANITRGMQYLVTSKYKPTDMFIGAEVLNDLQNIDTFVEADKAGNTTTMQTGRVGKIYGMNVWLVNSDGMTATTAYIIDRNKAFACIERRPLTLEKYEDAVHDISGATVTQRVAFKALRTSAIAKITSS